MTEPTNDFSHPATKVASCMAVTGSLQGVSPQPVIEVFGGGRAGLFVRIFTLSQYARARAALEAADLFSIALVGSLAS